MKLFNISLFELFYQKEDCFSIELFRCGAGPEERCFFKFYITQDYIDIDILFIKFRLFK